MKNKELARTNLLISIVLVIGFALTAVFSYRANYQASLDNIERVSSLTTEGIYYRLTTMFAKPVNISITMAHDSLLIEHLLGEGEHLEDENYAETIRTYLKAYQEKYDFDSVFLVSAATGRYYNFSGLDRVLTRDDPENQWYYDLMDSSPEYSLNVDNDEVDGADNEITVFVNCKITDTDGDVIGVVGVGIRIDYLKELLGDYEQKYNVQASLISGGGKIEISTDYTGYEQKDWFSVYDREELRRQILQWTDNTSNLEIWTDTGSGSAESSFVVARYIPELSWCLVVEQNTGRLIHDMKIQLYLTCVILITVILIVLLVTTAVIRKFNRQITALVEERQTNFKRATEEMYDNIYELNITKNCYVGKRTEEYFESLGAKGLPYDQGLRVIARKQIKDEFREGYVSTFTPENVIKEYNNNNNHLRYDFMITEDGINYNWMRIDAYILFSEEDQSIHMFTYRKNIDAEKQKELQAATDGMTGFFTRNATEHFINKILSENPGTSYAFFIFDIDNFKQANDQFGHAFGDSCIKEFTDIIRKHFREKDILGRIGGDEFAAFIPIPDADWVRVKAEELSTALQINYTDQCGSWNMSASIGVSVSPGDGTDFDSLYKKADAALYKTKQTGKNDYNIYSV